MLWAYPREYEDADAASAVAAGSRNASPKSAAIRRSSSRWKAMRCWITPPCRLSARARTVNDHFVEQLVMDAKAAIDKAVEMGVTDRDRVGVGGHSYGAFMTDNLLAHSDLFKAGIAESGAPNRTLTPFGFQNERRTIWEAPETLPEDVAVHVRR